MSIYIATDKKTGQEHYFRSESEFYSSNEYECKKYATLTDAIKDSEVWQSDHYSDGECLDYVMRAIAQLEGETE